MANPRRAFRDFVVEALSIFPLTASLIKVELVNRGVLWALFHLEGNEIVEAAVGPRFSRFRMWLDWQNRTSYVLGTYEPMVARALRKHVGQGQCCFDVGAHIGYYAILMSRLCGDRGHVIAFEPLPDNFEMLQKNIELNKLLNVGLEQAALGKDDGRVVLTFALHDRLSMTPSVSAYKVEGRQQRIEVPAYSLDSYVKKLGKTPDFILMDVEAAELAVLAGAQATLAKAHPTLLIEIHGWDARGNHDVERFLSNFGYVGQLLGQREKEAFVLFQAR